MAEIIEFFKDSIKLFIAIAIIVLIRIFVLTTTQVVGESMMPTLKDNSIMLVDQISVKFNNINRFDIIVLKYTSPSYLIKRVIGLPGETIEYKNNELYINGEKTENNFETIGWTENFKKALEDDEYFVLGDNREGSTDSRKFGPVKKEKIIGKPFFTIYPVKEIKIKK